MRLKFFFDGEYFQFVRDYVNLYKSLNKAAEQSSSQYFNDKLSESLRVKRLVELSAEFDKEEGVDTILLDQYRARYKDIEAKGEESLDIFSEEW